MKPIFDMIYNPSPVVGELEYLDFLKDKVVQGKYLRVDEVKSLKRLLRVYNSNKVTDNDIMNILLKVRSGHTVYI